MIAVAELLKGDFPEVLAFQTGTQTCQVCRTGRREFELDPPLKSTPY